MSTLAQRCESLTGSAIVLDGTSGSGKTYLACRIALANALATGGAILAYDPTGHVRLDIGAEESRYVKALDDARDKGDRAAINDALNRLALFQHEGRLEWFSAGEEEEFAATLRKTVTTRRTKPFGVILIDEGGFARNDSHAKQHLESAMSGAVPLARNARALVVLSGHRLMAAVPNIRAIMRARFMWSNPDPTARDQLVAYAEEQGWNIYSDAMGTPGREGKRRFYRGIRWDAGKARPFEIERDARLQEWEYLPAVMTDAPTKGMIL